MKEVLLIKNGELALKGLNRSTFEDVLVKNMKRRLLKSAGKFTFIKSQSTIVAEPNDEDVDFDAAVENKVFCCRSRVYVEVTDSLELQVVERLSLSKVFLNLALLENLE